MATDSSSPSKLSFKQLHPALLLLTLVFSAVEFVITAALVADYDNSSYPSNGLRDRLRFLLFLSTWNVAFIPIFLCVAWKPFAALSFLSSVVVNLGFNSLTWFLWLAGAAAWTDVLGGSLNCGEIFWGDRVIDVNIPYCDSLRAAQAFSWMIWITLSGVFAYTAVQAARARKAGNGLSGAMREANV